MSKAYSITYDLRQPGRDYTNLYEEIKKSPKWWHYLESTWMIITEESANQVWERIRPYIDKNDYLLIIGVRNDVQGWLPKDAWDWIHLNVPSILF
jgi:Fe-S cluster biosynthesis and repair protein YggX